MDDKEAPEVIAKITVNLAFGATNALLHLADELHMTKTDVTNRALQIYKYVNEHEMYVKEDGKIRAIKFE